MKPIDILGLKNFRIFDDKGGFLEEFSSINILTGANNSGKSSIVKALQLLKNSIRESKYPFNLDLNQQEHLLGDFDNILFNKSNRRVEVTLPFLFMGMKGFHIALTFESPNYKNTYKARLRGIDVIDITDNVILFSFQYREATDEEKVSYKVDFDKELQEFNDKEKKDSEEGANIFTTRHYHLFPPIENPLTGYVEWQINIEKLRHHLSELKKVYEYYLQNKKDWADGKLEELDWINRDIGIVPSAFKHSFKKDPVIEKWEEFIEKKIADEKEFRGKEHVGERDFEPDDFFIPPSEIENILFSKAMEVLKDNLKWKDTDRDRSEYSIIEHCFNKSWDGLIQRISTIDYVSNIKEENARSYNSASNSPFVTLLKNYESADIVNTHFIVKYLKAFQIGKKISVKLNPKYQSILVSITALDGAQRELVDFGYGIKQLILILMQISVLAEKNKRVVEGYDHEGQYMRDHYDPSLLIIEEPESNLHPKWQSLLADMFVEANKDFNIQLIIETHSEYLIRNFQTLVANKHIEAKNVKLFYLRGMQSVISGKKQIESLFIQEDGSINFGIFDDGFFDESYKLEMSLLNIQRDTFFKDFEDLKDNLQENEDKIIILQEKIDHFKSKEDVTVYEQIIKQSFDVAKLLPLTFDYLVSGQYWITNNNASGDFSPVIIQYGRAIENELLRIFSLITPKRWKIAEMQGSLEKYQNGTSELATCSHQEYDRLITALVNMFNVPINLKIDLLKDLRIIRNSAGHSGHKKTKQEAISYIQIANDFLSEWINQKK